MKLVHYSDHPIVALVAPEKRQGYGKPRGLWVSDDDAEHGWPEWCQSENFGLKRLTHVHDVIMSSDANVLILRSAFELDAFHERYGVTPDWARGLGYDRREPDWSHVASDYHGIIITPYIWSRRLDGAASNWYYGWDCASGCIWEPEAIAAISLRYVLDPLEVRGDSFKANYPPMLADGEYDRNM